LPPVLVIRSDTPRILVKKPRERVRPRPRHACFVTRRRGELADGASPSIEDEIRTALRLLLFCNFVGNFASVSFLVRCVKIARSARNLQSHRATRRIVPACRYLPRLIGFWPMRAPVQPCVVLARRYCGSRRGWDSAKRIAEPRLPIPMFSAKRNTGLSSRENPPSSIPSPAWKRGMTARPKCERLRSPHSVALAFALSLVNE